MKTKLIKVLAVIFLTTIIACSQNKPIKNNKTVKNVEPKILIKKDKPEPHSYGGWYCPDNLNGFPAVDISNWENVPVVKGRLATKEETQNGSSLIFIDTEKYPNARSLDISLPKLANYYNESTRRNELIIVIQAIKVSNDSIVGFRYLNGGNGSARLNEVSFLNKSEIQQIPSSKFVSHNIEIDSSQDAIWNVLTNIKYATKLQPIFDKNNKLNADWRKISNVNFHYSEAETLTSAYANKLFGNFYIQNDYDNLHYNEKFLVLENKKTKKTELKIVSGPYGNDFETQKNIIFKWAQKVKELSETLNSKN